MSQQTVARNHCKRLYRLTDATDFSLRIFIRLQLALLKLCYNSQDVIF